MTSLQRDSFIKSFYKALNWNSLIALNNDNYLQRISLKPCFNNDFDYKELSLNTKG